MCPSVWPSGSRVTPCTLTLSEIAMDTSALPHSTRPEAPHDGNEYYPPEYLFHVLQQRAHIALMYRKI